MTAGQTALTLTPHAGSPADRNDPTEAVLADFEAAMMSYVQAEIDDVTPALDRLLARLENQPAAAYSLRRAVERFVSEDGRQLRQLGESHSVNDRATGRRRYWSLSWLMWATIDETFPRGWSAQPELEAARTAAQRLEHEHDRLRAAMRTAIDKADRDTVMALRDGPLAALPAQMAKARGQLLQLEVRRARAVLARSEGRAEAAAAAQSAAAETLAELRRQVEAAEMTLQDAKHLSDPWAKNIADWARRETQDAERALDTHRVEASTAARDAARRLADVPR